MKAYALNGHVDIFDAGPILEVRTRHIRAIRHVEQTQALVGDEVLQASVYSCATIAASIFAALLPVNRTEHWCSANLSWTVYT